MSDTWVALSTEYGLRVDRPTRLDGAGDLTLSGPGLPATEYQVKVFSDAVTPKGVEKIAERASSGPMLLLLAPSASTRTRQRALTLGISLLVTAPDGPPTGFLIARDGTHLSLEPSTRPQAPRTRGKVPWATYETSLQLLERPASSQVDLARRVGVSQPRIAQILAGLDAYVVRSTGSWRAAPGLERWLVESYPGEVSVRTNWLTLDPVVAVGSTVSHHLAERGVAHAVSGDVAADRLAPWSRPDTLRVWTQAPVDLSPLGLTPAPASSANVTLLVPRDPYMLRRVETRQGLPLQTPWRVWLDLAQNSDPQAAEHLALALRSGRVAG